jgi:Tfp pilus assembly protein PilF
MNIRKASLTVTAVLGIAGVVALALTGSACNKLKARNQLNTGVQSFKNAQYAEAVESFKKAVDLDPDLPSARLYLATAYMQQYIPGAESPENLQMAQAAREHFMKVLEQVPNDSANGKVALASLASLYLNQKQFDEAQKWNEKLIAVDPQNKEAYYSLGWIAWSKWYPAYGAARAELHMRQEDPGPIKDKKVKEELKAKWDPVIQAGLQSLDKALQIDPEYEDAMAYENLLIRERADLVDTKEEYEKQIKVAEQWIEKNLATRKAKAEKKAKESGGGITLDSK